MRREGEKRKKGKGGKERAERKMGGGMATRRKQRPGAESWKGTPGTERGGRGGTAGSGKQQ